MRIALNGSLVNQCVSGVDKAIYGLAQALATYGQEHYTFYLPRNSPQADIHADARFTTRRVGVSTRFRFLRIFWEQVVLPRQLRRDGADLLHAPAYVSPVIKARPTVLTVYDLIALRFPELCKRSNVYSYRLQLPRAIRRADRIIVPSSCARRDLAVYFPDAEAKTVVVPLAVDTCFQPCTDPQARKRVRERYRLPQFFVLFVGQVEPKKNVVGLLDAYALLRGETGCPHELVVAGRRGWRSGPVEAAVAAHEMQNEVHFTGQVALEDLPILYSMADLFVFPSLYEGFGLPPLEAMACGTPVIVSDRGSLPEVAGDAAQVVDPTDVARLVDTMELMLMNPDLRVELTARGRQRAAEFTWERVARETEVVYRDLHEG